MIEAASTHGYANATVARVIALTGISRATFYRNFESRDHCFLVAYRIAAEGIRAPVQATAAASPPGEGTGAVLDVLLARLAADPATARFVLVESLAGPASVRAEHEKLVAELELLLAGFLDRQGKGGAIQIPAVALLAGIGGILAARIMNGFGNELEDLRGDLVGWIDAYRLPLGVEALPQDCWRELGRFAGVVAPAAVSHPSLLPRGRHALPPNSAATVRRRRLLDATARVTAESGYASLTVARIAAAARVPRAAFYSHFESKQEALLEAQTHALQGAMAAAASAYSPVGPWPVRIWKAVEAFLAFVAANPEYAYLDLVEACVAGPAAVRRRTENYMSFALFVEAGYRQSPSAAYLPRLSSEAIAAAIFGLMRKLVLEGKTDRMLSLLPAATYTIAAPFIGAEGAYERVQEWARGER
jgi:AcrR family transcriptional regulator